MAHLDEEGLKARGGVGKKKHERKGHFTTKGLNYVSLLTGMINCWGIKTIHSH